MKRFVAPPVFFESVKDNVGVTGVFNDAAALRPPGKSSNAREIL